MQRHGSHSRTAQPGRTQLSLRCPQLPAQEQDPTHSPAYPVEQLLWGENFAIFIQPREEGKPSCQCCQMCRLGLLSPHKAVRTPARVGGLGLGYLYVLHSTRREYTESKSLSTSRPAAWGAGGKCQGQQGRSQVKATGSNSPPHEPLTQAPQSPGAWGKRKVGNMGPGTDLPPQ